LATVFVFAVILAGPLIGLAFMVFAQRVGAALIALTMEAPCLRIGQSFLYRQSGSCSAR
jgi:hypothetical protein